MAITGKTRRLMTNIALIVMCVTILAGVALSVYFLVADDHIIQIDIVPDETKEIRFEELYLRPGESSAYTLSLRSELTEEYLLTLRFEDRDTALTLKEYAYVRVEKDGAVLCDILLAEMFEQQTVELAVDFTDGGINDVKVIYYMPADVGNEAQRTEADFTLLVTATNE